MNSINVVYPPMEKKRELSKRLIGVIEGKNVNDLLSKENLKCMIKEILKVKFTTQEENITKLINANFQTNMAELKKSQDDNKRVEKWNKWLQSKSSIYRKWT